MPNTLKNMDKGKRKARVTWMIEDTTGEYITTKDRLVLGLCYQSKSLASKFGKPISFIESTKERGAV
jgi:hypothetical protein